MLAAAVVIGGCGGDEETTPGDGDAPAASATDGEEAPTTSGTSPTTEAAADPCERELENPPGDTPRGGRDGGKYKTSVFQPPFTLDFGKHSFSSLQASCDHVYLLDFDALDDGSVPGSLLFVNDLAVRADPAVEVQDLPVPPDPASEDVDLGSWLHGHPRLSTTEQQAVTIAGLEGTQFDAEVDPEKAYDTLQCGGAELPAATATGADLECVVVFGFGPSSYVLPVDYKWRVIALDVGGKQVVLVIEAAKADFDVHAAKVEEILPTLKFQSG